MTGASGISPTFLVLLSLVLFFSSCASHPIVHQTLASMQTKSNPGVRIPLTVRPSSNNQPPSFKTPRRFDPDIAHEELKTVVRQDTEGNTSTETTSTESTSTTSTDNGESDGTDTSHSVEGQTHEHSGTESSNTTSSTGTTNDNAEGADSHDGENSEGNSSEETKEQATSTNDSAQKSEGRNENQEGTSGGDEQEETGDKKEASDEDGDDSKPGETNDKTNSETTTKEGGETQQKTDTTGDSISGSEGSSNVTASSQNTTSSEVTSEGATNQTHAFLKFKLIQFVESDTSDGFKDVTVFEEGKLAGPFVSSPNTSDVGSLSDASTEDMYNDIVYADRIAFKFLFDENSSDYAFEQPTVVTTSASVVNPVMKGYRLDENNAMGLFTIHYHCKSGVGGKAFVGLKLPITKNHTLAVTWSKECGKGRFGKLEFGFSAHDRSISLFNEDGTYGKEEQKRLEVGPTDTSTELSMKLIPPAFNLDFLDPVISSDSSDVIVSLRGAITGDTLTSEHTTRFNVLYECKAMSKAEIKFSVGIPPWDNVTATWRKDCGGSYSQALLIGTTKANSFEVMQDGELSPRYNVTESSSLSDISASIARLSGTEKTARFYLTNSDDTADLQIQTISTTMSNPDVLASFIRTPSLSTGGAISGSGGVLHRKETKSLFLHFMCKRAGSSLVLITLPVLRYKNIEFGFVKECFEPKSYHESGFLQTAGSILGTVLAVLILGGLASFIYIRRRTSEAKYARVSTTENGSLP